MSWPVKGFQDVQQIFRRGVNHRNKAVIYKETMYVCLVTCHLSLVRLFVDYYIEERRYQCNTGVCYVDF
jgi:hypothetical protein